MRLSYIILSHNRREALLRTLALLPGLTPLRAGQWETWVVDNASRDGTVEAVQKQFGHVNLVRNKVNQGVAAANHAFARCGGEFVILLDECTSPAEARNITLMLSHLGAHQRVGAVVGKVLDSDGIVHAPAMASMLMPGSTCFRKSVLEKTEGFRLPLRGHAAELDLTCRIWQSGYRIDRREDIIFSADMTDFIPAAVAHPASANQRALRDNLLIAKRFMPSSLAKIYWQDARLRYEALARHNGSISDLQWGIWSARARAAGESFSGRMRLNEEALECVFGLRKQAVVVGDWARRNSVWRVVLADFSENFWATYNACRSSGLQLRCIADENPAFEGLEYRGLPIISSQDAFEGGGIDGVVIANQNPAQIDARMKRLRRCFKGPILRLWEPPRLATQVRPVALAA